MDRLRIGLIGWGTMGAALGELVLNGPLPLTLARIAVRDPARARSTELPKGIEVGTPEDLLVTDVVVELAGGVDGPREWARATLDRGAPYVTANKALLATHGGELAQLADRRVAALLGSASVGGGTPMIEVTNHLASTGRIERIRGAINATTTYIFEAMGDGRTYDDALHEAQDAGYAEPDATLDVTGRDAAQKIAILASVAWSKWRPESEVDTTGIVETEVGPGETVRLVAEATKDAMVVAPMRIDPSDRLARTAGVENLLEITMRDGSVFRVSGPGAGGTASITAVYADLACLVAGERPILFSRG